jgi:hypothetical protein
VPHALLFVRALLLLTFGVSALSKARSASAFAAFRAAVEDFEVVPRRGIGLVAVAVAAIEAGVAAGLAAGGPAMLPAFGAAVALLLVLSWVLVRTLQRHRRIRCNCFGSASAEVSWFDVGRNAVLVAAAAVGAVGLLQGTHAAGTGADVALAVLMAGVALALLLSLRDIVVTLRRPFTFIGDLD